VKLTHSNKPRAFAVIIVLVVVTVLTLLAGAFAYSMKIETRLAANANDDEQFYWMARAGAERACWWKSLDNGPFSSTHQYWAGGPGEGPETNSPLALESLASCPVGAGTVSIKMVELESLININAADQPLLQNVLEQMNVGPDLKSVVTDSILDWIDTDDGTRPAGAESDYYQGQGGYDAKNAPIDNMDELQLIKGVTRAMYTGQSENTMSTPFPTHRLGVGTRPGEENYTFGLRDVFTPFSSGKVNWRTASSTVLQALPGIDEATAEAIVNARDADPPVRDLNQLLGTAGMNPAAAQQAMRYFDGPGHGNTYKVTITATIGQLSHTYTAIIFRDGRLVSIYNFYRSE